MQFNPGFSSLAALLADPGRAQMIWALMDGSARPASELALLAGVSPSSASGHLGRLVEGGVLSLEARGRNRFYRLAGPEVGQAVEALVSASLALQPQRRSLPPSHGTP
ncbi:ArsR/SmtB family transcription factor, partial [Pseudomonas aeruginosa]